MKRSAFLTLLSVSILIFGLYGQASSEGKKDNNLNEDKFKEEQKKVQRLLEDKMDKMGPSISFEKYVHDYGEIPPKSNNKCEFKFTNVGNKVLKIKKIK